MCGWTMKSGSTLLISMIEDEETGQCPQHFRRLILGMPTLPGQ
jgi:hypothetical protein